jgi:hypothetical protein
MIKFYQGSYSELNTQGHLFGTGNANKICFVTDRQVLMMGGQEYGRTRDSLYIQEGSGYTADGTVVGMGSTNPPVSAGTLFFFKGDQSILRWEGADQNPKWTQVQFGTLSSADLLSTTVDADQNIVPQYIDLVSGTVVFSDRAQRLGDNYQATVADIKRAIDVLEDKIEGAYTTTSTESTKLTQAALATTPSLSGTNNILVSNTNGIKRTDVSIDNGTITDQILDTSLSASQKSADLDKTLVNGRTLAKVYEDLKSQAVTMKTSDGPGSGFITWTPSTTLAGTEWTPTFHVLTGSASGALVNNDGTLETKFAIRQLTSSDTTYGYNDGYRAQYALFNLAGDTPVKLGDTINLVKDQFLKDAEYVKAVPLASADGGYIDATAENWANATYKQAMLDATVPAEDQSTYTTFEQWDAAYGNKINRFLKFIFTLKRPETEGGTNGDTDSIVYINVNELFDSYKGYSGVDVDQGGNIVSGVINPTGNETRKGSSDTYYFNLEQGLNTGSSQKHGFYITGIKEDMEAYIQDLQWTGVSGAASGLAVDQGRNLLTGANNKFITQIGVDANGKLTGEAASGFAAGIVFDSITGGTAPITTGTTLNVDETVVQGAISSIALHIGSLDYTYDGDTNKPMTEFVSYIKQTDGLIVASGHIVKADDLEAHAEYSAKLSGVLTGLNAENNKPEYQTVEIDRNIYAISSTDEQETGSIQQALGDIVDTTFAAINNINMARIGAVAGNTNMGGETAYVPSAVETANQYAPYKIINTIKQQGGYVYATDLELIAQNVGFRPITGKKGLGFNKGTGEYETDATSGYIPVSGYTIGAALSSISNYIGSLDFDNTATSGNAPSAASAPGYSVIQSVTQDNGQLSAQRIDLTTENIYTSGIVEVATGASSAVRVGVPAGSIQAALDKISNIIADFGSFHDPSGNVI